MVTPPKFLKRLFANNFIFEIPTFNKEIYLTFDDGPTPGVTEFIIEELNRFNAKATFFSVGQNIIKHPDTFRLYINNQHKVGNHTYSHLNGWKTKDTQYFEDVNKFNEIYKTKLFRPPYGKIRMSQTNQLKEDYKIYLWSIISRDFDKTLSREKCLRNVLINAQEGSIIVFHDSIKASPNLIYALPRILDHYSDKGYTFRSL